MCNHWISTNNYCTTVSFFGFITSLRNFEAWICASKTLWWADNMYLQIFRHLHVLASENRSIEAIDVETLASLQVPIRIVKKSTGKHPETSLEGRTPYLLPPLDQVSCWDVSILKLMSHIKIPFAKLQALVVLLCSRQSLHSIFNFHSKLMGIEHYRQHNNHRTLISACMSLQQNEDNTAPICLKTFIPKLMTIGCWRRLLHDKITLSSIKSNQRIRIREWWMFDWQHTCRFRQWP